MPFVIAIAAVCPLRKESSHRSEMVSQLLAGEAAEVLEVATDFIRVQSLYDNYEGWCQKSQVLVLEQLPAAGKKWLSKERADVLYLDGQPMYLSPGTPLEWLMHQEMGGYTLEYKGGIWDIEEAIFSASLIKEVAYRFLHTPYLWGGRSAFGIDCSGLTQQVYRHFGIALLRDAYQQAASGEPVGFIQEAQCGDLAFFDNAEGKITHVGIMLGADRIIHASGQVRIDSIDHEGIIHCKTGVRTHHLRVIKRYQ